MAKKTKSRECTVNFDETPVKDGKNYTASIFLESKDKSTVEIIQALMVATAQNANHFLKLILDSLPTKKK